MHEAGIAASIIDIAQNAAHGRAITKIHLTLGAFTGVVQEALEFAFEAIATGAILEIERVLLIGACPQCRWTGPPEEDYCLICPRCNSPVAIVSGREMQVAWIELEENLDGTCHCGDQSSKSERPICRS